MTAAGGAPTTATLLVSCTDRMGLVTDGKTIVFDSVDAPRPGVVSFHARRLAIRAETKDLRQMARRTKQVFLVISMAAACAGCSSGSAGTGGTDAADGAAGDGADAVDGRNVDAGADAEAASSTTDAVDGQNADASAEAPADAAGSPDAGAADGAVTGELVVTAPTFSVAMKTEPTECVVLDLGNEQTVHVGRIETTISAPVYEVRIAAVTGAAQTTPSPCVPFADLGDATVRPLFFGRNKIEPMSFPAGVGYTLAPHQLLRFEIHAWNPTLDALNASVTARFTASSDAAFQHEAGLLYVELGGFSIAAHGTGTFGPFSVFVSPALAPASILRLEGYTHELGISVAMALAPGATLSPAIYAPDPWNPANPFVADEAPPVALPATGGVALTCAWNNSQGVVPVQAGPAEADERCGVFISYYPAAAAHSCVRLGVAPNTLCCPGGAGCPQ